MNKKILQSPKACSCKTSNCATDAINDKSLPCTGNREGSNTTSQETAYSSTQEMLRSAVQETMPLSGEARGETLYFSKFEEAFDAVIKKINARIVDLDVRHILIVPDKYTLDIETRLFADSAGAFDVEVLTFPRLFYKVCDKKDYLGREGAIMMIRGICQSLELSCYKKSARFTGFAQKVYDTFNMLADCGVDIASATAQKTAAEAKLGDIKAIYERYQSLTANKFMDRNGRLSLLAKGAEKSDYIKKAHIYVAGFMDFTRGEKEVLEALKQNALSFTLCSLNGTLPAICAKKIELYDCVGMASALKAAARRIRAAIIEGMRYRDICIAVAQTDLGDAERIFSEYEIPYYADQAYQLSWHPLSRYIESIMELIEKYYRRKDVLLISKNAYMGIPKKDSDTFEGLVKEYNITGQDFFEEFSSQKFGAVGKKDEERLKISERVRKSIMDKLQPLEDCYKKICSAYDFAAFVRKIMQSAAKDSAVDFSSPDIHTASAEQKIEEVLLLMEKILGEASHRQSFLREVFLEGAASIALSAIPNLSDSVVIGSPATFRGQPYKYVFVLGASEGVMPAPRQVEGLFSDQPDAVAGVQIKPDNHNATELYQLLCSAKSRIFVSYDSTQEGGLSAYLREVLEPSRDIICKNSQALEQARLASDAFVDFVADFCCSRASAAEVFTSNVSGFRTMGQIQEYNASLYQALKQFGIDKYVFREAKGDHIDCKGLYFGDGSISVTRLQEYFGCPYAHFIKYGLSAKPNKEGEVLAVDIGTILHSVVELFVGRPEEWHDVEKSCNCILEQVIAAQPSLKFRLTPQMHALLCKESIELCSILKNHFQQGSFVPLGQEITLGSQGSLAPLIITAETEEEKRISLQLSGSVDYADVFDNRVRIIDYKTGKAKFSYADIYYGKKLQLALYMQVFVQNGYRPAGFFFFPFSRRWNDDQSAHRLRGVFDKNLDVVFAMDKSLRNGAKSNIIYAKTSFFASGEFGLFGRHDYALTEQQLAEICNYAKESAECAASEIAQGYAAKSPYKSGKECACDYCDYTSICAESYQNARLLQADASPLEKKPKTAAKAKKKSESDSSQKIQPAKKQLENFLEQATRKNNTPKELDDSI